MAGMENIMDNHFIMRLISLSVGGIMLFGCIGNLIHDPIGTYIGAVIGFCFGSWLAWYRR